GGLAQILGVTCRSMDIAARFGGDELALILPQTTKDDARKVAYRLMDRVRKFRVDGHLQLTLSMGLAAFPEDGITPNALFSVADYARSEEHTSELQSRENLVCRLLLGKKTH